MKQSARWSFRAFACRCSAMHLEEWTNTNSAVHPC
ncbi:hypothetical protein M3J09_008266 [Ascochyta lentis]